jgi:protein-arginine kinase activator protein McsA
MPITEEMKGQKQKGGAPMKTLACADCGRTFTKKATNKSRLCQRCRQRATDHRWRAANPEQYKQTQNKHQGLIKEKQARLRELKKEW